MLKKWFYCMLIYSLLYIISLCKKAGMMMKNAYLAICYVCNEKCRYCPCSAEEKNTGLCTPLNELLAAIDEMRQNNVDNITISGGEPTLHPDLIPLLQYIQNHHMSFTLLTNSERFSSEKFMSEFAEKVKNKDTKIITTLHSESESAHELANQTSGSYQRTISGMKALIQNGFRVIVKHCITKENYRNLVEYYTYYDKLFPEQSDFQLCGIDYCGMPSEVLENEMLSFVELKPYLEEMFDLHLKRKEEGSNRKLYCINIPLCSCDPYYWTFFSLRRKNMYASYKDPHQLVLKQSKNNAFPCGKACKECKTLEICGGTYISAFEFFGDKIIKPYK